MKGKLQKISEIRELKSGSGKKGPWTLWGCNLTVDGKDYGLTEFDEAKLEEKVAKLKTGSVIDFETELKGEYTNVKQKTEIKVLEEGKGQAGPTPAPSPDKPKMADDALQNVWKETAEFVYNYWKEKKVVVDSVDMIGPSINTIYQAKMRARGLR